MIKVRFGSNNEEGVEAEVVVSRGVAVVVNPSCLAGEDEVDSGRRLVWLQHRKMQMMQPNRR